MLQMKNARIVSGSRRMAVAPVARMSAGLRAPVQQTVAQSAPLARSVRASRASRMQSVVVEAVVSVAR